MVGLPKVGKCADLPTTQKGLWPRLATTATRQAVGICRSFLSAPKALAADCLKGLKDFKGFKGPTPNRRPRHSVAPPARRGRRAPFRPPLPASPIVGEMYFVGASEGWEVCRPTNCTKQATPAILNSQFSILNSQFCFSFWGGAQCRAHTSPPTKCHRVGTCRDSSE